MASADGPGTPATRRRSSRPPRSTGHGRTTKPGSRTETSPSATPSTTVRSRGERSTAYAFGRCLSVAADSSALTARCWARPPCRAASRKITDGFRSISLYSRPQPGHGYLFTTSPGQHDAHKRPPVSRRGVDHVEAGRLDRHLPTPGQPCALRARSSHRHVRLTEQTSSPAPRPAAECVADRRRRRNLPIIAPGAESVQATHQAAHQHRLVRGLDAEQPHRDHVTEHHVRWQPPEPLLTPPTAVEYLFQQIPVEPGGQARCDRSTDPAAAATPPQTRSCHGTVPAAAPRQLTPLTSTTS